MHADVDPDLARALQRGLIGWYIANGRDLPWRRTTDPYAILVSEILLHQTQVATALPVYEAVVARWPSFAALAAAPLDEVKAVTDPLGYHIRGEWLHRIAGIVINELEGRLPDTLEGLLELPGIGRYTAGAILSFAFQQDAPIVDTNVERLLSRLFDLHAGRPPAALRQKRLWALAEALIPPGHGYLFNQALMDFGAQVCTPYKPVCLFCPLRAHCQWWNPRPDGGVTYRED
ncbi:MAG TPA: A/G-specific adenine glycosylase [Chloroflexia bacterium]|nr:A/G-specific adenine glycosylase [Chloroflexia bacterium]